MLTFGGNGYHSDGNIRNFDTNIRGKTATVLYCRSRWCGMSFELELTYGELSQKQLLKRDQSTRRILAVAAAVADSHSCWWWWRCCCCCVPSRLGFELKQGLEKLAVSISGRKCQHRSGICYGTALDQCPTLGREDWLQPKFVARAEKVIFHGGILREFCIGAI